MYAKDMTGESNPDTTENQTYTIQETARRTRLSEHTLRYYERAGLLPPPPRQSGSGHRRYTDEDLRRIQFVKRMRATGMSIRDMQAYVALYNAGDTTLEARTQMLEAHRYRVLEQMAELSDCLTLIEYKITSYRQLGSDKNWSKEEGVCDK